MLDNKIVNRAALFGLFFLLCKDYYQDVPLWHYAILVLVVIALKTYGSIFISSNFYVKAFCKGSSESNTVALTFDDGPLPDLTNRILEILEAHQVKATFFCIGHRVEKHPELVQQIHAQGHLIGNHSFYHGKFFDLQTSSALSNELQMTNEAIYKIIGEKPTFFRPPYGVTNPALAKAITKGKYIAAGWSIRSMDTVANDEEKLFQKITRNIKSGDVILLHDYSETMINILPQLIEYIKSRELKIIRLDELQ